MGLSSTRISSWFRTDAAAAIFCASPKKDGACLKELRATLEERGIKVLPEELIVHGKGGFLSGKNPTEEDLEAARKFANACMDKALKHEI